MKKIELALYILMLVCLCILVWISIFVWGNLFCTVLFSTLIFVELFTLEAQWK